MYTGGVGQNIKIEYLFFCGKDEMIHDLARADNEVSQINPDSDTCTEGR
jgi:hypothetical protein